MRRTVRFVLAAAVAAATLSGAARAAAATPVTVTLVRWPYT